MNHYRHHIGDYRRDTSHLSLLEHGVYRQLLDQLYLTERPLPLDQKRVMRSLCVRSADEERAVCEMLAEFFVETPDGYVQDRATRELEAIYAKSEKARASANRKWDKEKQRVAAESGQKIDDTKTHSERICERNANAMLPSNPVTQYPVPSNPVKQPSRSPNAGKYSDEFAQFWTAYPNRKGKAVAFKAWQKLSADDRSTALTDIQLRAASDQEWLRDGGQYIPHASTYLTQRRWDDDITLENPNGSQQRTPERKLSASEQVRAEYNKKFSAGASGNVYENGRLLPPHE